jgi:hypothetical protein
VAELALQLHVVFDLIEGHVTWAFDHDLHAGPGAFGQLPERLEFGQLRFVGRIGEPAGAQAVADRERDIVRA